MKRNAKHANIQTVIVSVARALMGVLLDIADQILDVHRVVCITTQNILNNTGKSYTHFNFITFCSFFYC